MITTARVPFLDLNAVNAPLRESLDLALKTVLTHGVFVGGPEVALFESEFAAYCDARACVGVANGTDSLELILAGLGIRPGDEVIVPGNTFVATAEAVCAVGARPKFVDVHPDTLLLDADAAAAAVSTRTAAIIAVHIYGQMADMPRLAAIAARHGLALIEDAAQAHGAPARCLPVANHPDAESVYHLAVVMVDDPTAVMRDLDQAGIGWGRHYPVPCNQQPAFADYAVGLPVVDAAAKRIISLPMSPMLTAGQISYVCAALKSRAR